MDDGFFTPFVSPCPYKRCDSDDHYMKDGEPYCRISNIVDKAVEHFFFGWTDKEKKIAADYGTRLHKLAEEMYAGKFGLPWKAASDCGVVDPKETELTVYDDEYKVAGTFDAEGILECGGIWVGDWKSSKAATEEHKVKTAWYAKQRGAKQADVICLGSGNNKGYSRGKVKIDEGYNVILDYLKKYPIV